MLTLQFIPYSEIESLTSDQRVKKLLTVVKQNKIVLLEGRLKKTEETELIQKTMESISDDFKGIELAVIFPEGKYKKWFDKLKRLFYNMLLGDRLGMTIMGPATVVKEIKKDPDKIQLFTTNGKRKKRKK